MTAAHRRYIAVEALIGATISAVLSIAFVWLVFGVRNPVPVAGIGGLIVDAVPQGFAIAFMATLVPTLLTRRRLARGTVPSLAGARRAPPARAMSRAIATGLLGAGLTVLLTALVLVIGMERLAFPIALAGKTVWGLVFGGIVAATATRAALAPSSASAARG